MADDLQTWYKIYLDRIKKRIRWLSMHKTQETLSMHFHPKRGMGRHFMIRGMFGHRHGHGPFGGFGPDFAGGGGEHRGRRGKRFAGDELRLMVLGLLADGPQHGYQLIRGFSEKSGEGYSPSPGVLYPLLALLADMGLAREVEGGGARRSYELTEDGVAEVEGKREVIDALFARLAAMAEEATRTDHAPVRRAMMNLRMATVARVTREGADRTTALEIARLLDEAAQAIERL